MTFCLMLIYFTGIVSHASLRTYSLHLSCDYTFFRILTSQASFWVKDGKGRGLGTVQSYDKKVSRSLAEYESCPRFCLSYTKTK